MGVPYTLLANWYMMAAAAQSRYSPSLSSISSQFRQVAAEDFSRRDAASDHRIFDTSGVGDKEKEICVNKAF